MLDTMLTDQTLPMLMLVVGIVVGILGTFGVSLAVAAGRQSPGQLWPDGEDERR